MFASISDINLHLPTDKVQISDGEDDGLQIDAYRLIRARLVSSFGIDVINSWTDIDDTPEQIRGIAGKLIAAKYYSILVSEDEPDGSVFAQNLFNEAMAELEGIRTGLVSLIGVDGIEIENSDIMETSFWPNNSTLGPSFTTADTWS